MFPSLEKIGERIDRFGEFLKRHKTLYASVLTGVIAATVAAYAAQTNYLGTVFIADTTTPANQLKVNADGSINTSAGAGSQPAPLAVTPTDRGGTITLGGTSQTLAASNASRKQLFVQNPCTAAGQGGIGAAEDLFIAVTGAATVNGAGNYADLAPCGSATVSVNGTVITAAVTVNAATTGHRWSATEAQ